ncbi:MAG TPA: transcriptional regulator [Lactococcus sp.]|nr:transcriptional regulator [Lactococcus sp.]
MTLSNRRRTLIKNRLKVLRAERDWTQEELANRAKISRQAVISIEKYKYQPSLELAYTLAEVFELPITEVFIHQKEEEV